MSVRFPDPRSASVSRSWGVLAGDPERDEDTISSPCMSRVSDKYLLRQRSMAASQIKRQQPHPAQLLVLGMHHSGTSVVSKLIVDAGVYLGKPSDMKWHATNPLKYFERKDVNAANIKLLETACEVRFLTRQQI